jgi:hypothetical protein
MRGRQALRLNHERFFEFAKHWLLPLILGFVIGLAIFLLVNIYRLLNSASLLVVNWNPLLLSYKRDVETEVFVPASIASVTAYFTSAITLGTETIFPSINFYIANIFRPFTRNFNRYFDSFCCLSIYGNSRENKRCEQAVSHQISIAFNERTCWTDAGHTGLVLSGSPWAGL